MAVESHAGSSTALLALDARLVVGGRGVLMKVCQILWSFITPFAHWEGEALGHY